MGRLAAYAAKQALLGNPVTIVNCSKVIISGNPKTIIADFKKRLEIGTPKWGPFYPKTPAGIMRRACRGMLPWKKQRGKEAYHKIKCHGGLPKELADKEITKLETKLIKNVDWITLGDLCNRIGKQKGAK